MVPGTAVHSDLKAWCFGFFFLFLFLLVIIANIKCAEYLFAQHVFPFFKPLIPSRPPPPEEEIRDLYTEKALARQV